LRTVQRWERTRGLPVYRAPGGKRNAIFALKSELDRWWHARKPELENPAEPVSEIRSEPSIAVLPFANLSTEKENEYFSDSLAEEIINALTHVAGLKVTARSSSFAFRGQDEDARKIGNALGVRFILEGSVRRIGGRVRVSTQLINATDGYHLWSDRFDREMTDIFAVEDSIAHAIVDTLKLKLSAPRPKARNLDAYDAYLKGRYHYYKYSPEGLVRSKECFKEAIALDPQYAPAHAGLANYYYACGVIALAPPREVMPVAREAALQALQLDPTLQEAHAALGVVAAVYDADWNEAERQFRLAMSNEPISPFVRHRYVTYYLLPQRRFTEGVAEMELALGTDPLSVVLRHTLGRVLAFAESPERAIQEWRKALEIDERFWLIWCAMGLTYAKIGEWEQAIDALDTAHELAPPQPLVAGPLAGIYQRLGDKGRSEQLLTELKTCIHPDLVWFGLALYHCFCLEFEKAADALEKAIEVRDSLAHLAGFDYSLEGVRCLPRWPGLAGKLNVPAVS
jgi:serine/threonine-protein kinase